MQISHLRNTLLITIVTTTGLFAQPFGQPDRALPGDRAIQQYLALRTRSIHTSFDKDLVSLEAWKSQRKKYLHEYFYMLGLWPLPAKTPLRATVTRTLQEDSFVVEMLHYQSRPGLYVTGNLYRPARIEPGQRLPAVLYVCGHASNGRNGNKTSYHSNGIWFARHGYVCLVVDTLQLGEIAGIHHGTYREQRWWWHSRGYTPAGVECWNGIRGIDYLTSRPDVDPDRIGVTGISGGGAATFWIAAADERVHLAVPVSGMADLPSYVTNRLINGHCDCMMMYNTFQWPWTRIASLVAPRPLLFVNSDHDPIFPMDANDRVINRLERLYGLHGASDQVDAVISAGDHNYRRDIRKAVYRFINMHLQGNPAEVLDSEVDLATSRSGNPKIPLKQLRVFPTDEDLPSDPINATVDEVFVPVAHVELPRTADYQWWKEKLVAQLRHVTFRGFPQPFPVATLHKTNLRITTLNTEPGIRVRLHLPGITSEQTPVALTVTTKPLGKRRPAANQYILEPRGVGASRWTSNNPPNFVERSHALLGTTVDAGRVWDIAATYRYVRRQVPDHLQVVLRGEGAAAVLAAYAAVLEPAIAQLDLTSPLETHMNQHAPQLLNVLRVCDIPDTIGLLAPRHLRLHGADSALIHRVRALYATAGAADKLHLSTP